VITVREHDRQPTPADIIELTCTPIRRLFTTLIVEPARALACPRSPGHTGDDATNIGPEPPTTSANKRPAPVRNNLRPEH
jgi:hypothetical protein